MLSLTAPPHFIISANYLTDLTRQSTPSTLFLTTFSRRGKIKKQERCLPPKEVGFLLRFVGVKKINYKESCWGFSGGGGFLRRCKRGWVSEGDIALEAEILAFMDGSENPGVFPSKQQLIDAGRRDLAEAIEKQGGWLASGWDLNGGDSNNDNQDYTDWFMVNDKECNSRESGYEVSVWNADSPSASSSGTPLETDSEDDSGIEGILSRLEKARNMTLGLKDMGSNSPDRSNVLNHDWVAKTSKFRTDAGLKGNNRLASGARLDHSGSLSIGDGLKNSLKPDMWRTWSIQRAGLSGKEFEAAEIHSNRIATETEIDTIGGVIQNTEDAVSLSLSRMKENSSLERINQSPIKSRLLHLELELSSVLQSLKSKTSESFSQNVRESSPDDLSKLSDGWEFQENEIMNALNRLRSIRARVAVLEGKLALSIIDAQKMVEGRQKRIDDARRALQLLRTACIVWPNSGSEVLLAGSFDGWGTQRKMTKSNSGVFSLYLKLYPGKYEIKFIVDGEWRVDPLRPIVGKKGYENNLLIIT